MPAADAGSPAIVLPGCSFSWLSASPQAVGVTGADPSRGDEAAVTLRDIDLTIAAGLLTTIVGPVRVCVTSVLLRHSWS